MTTLFFILGLMLFLGLIVVHELGHFWAARMGGVEIQEFGIGFPPRLLKKRMPSGWLLSFNVLPLGGFVKLKGEHDSDKGEGTFGEASIGTKSKILVAGVVMNLFTAYVLLVLLALVGMPQVVDDQFLIKGDAVYLQRARIYDASDVEKGSPAAKAGIKTDDTIVALGKAPSLTKLQNPGMLPHLTQQYAGQEVEIAYRHGNNGRVIYAKTILRSEAIVSNARKVGKQTGYLGVSVYRVQTRLGIVRSTWSAPIVAAGLIKQFTMLTFDGLGKAVLGLGSIIAGSVTGNAQVREAGQAAASSQVSGPVGIFFIFKHGSTLGFTFVLFIIALLSLTLALMNILPIPALDGGRLWLLLVTRAIKKPLNQTMEEAINVIGISLVMGLGILVAIVDVRRFF